MAGRVVVGAVPAAAAAAAVAIGWPLPERVSVSFSPSPLLRESRSTVDSGFERWGCTEE